MFAILLMPTMDGWMDRCKIHFHRQSKPSCVPSGWLARARIDYSYCWCCWCCVNLCCWIEEYVAVTCRHRRSCFRPLYPVSLYVHYPHVTRPKSVYQTKIFPRQITESFFRVHRVVPPPLHVLLSVRGWFAVKSLGFCFFFRCCCSCMFTSRLHCTTSLYPTTTTCLTVPSVLYVL